jgi:hypothetical protein
MSGENQPRIGRSISRTRADGKTARFSSLDDFIKPLRDSGQLPADALLEEHPELLPVIFQAWVKGAQVGCLFAVDYANRQDGKLRGSWQQLVVNDAPSVDTLHRRLNNVLVSPRPPEALSVLFPRMKDAAGVATLISQLCEDPRWGWEEIESEQIPKFYLWAYGGGCRTNGQLAGFSVSRR